MSKKLSRILALVLAVSISFNSLPLAAFATDSNSDGSGDIVIEQIVQDVVNTDETADTPDEPITDTPDEPVTDTPDKTPSDPAADTPDEPAAVTPDKTPSDPAADTPDETVTVTPDKTSSDPAADTPDEPVADTPDKTPSDPAADTPDEPVTVTPADKTARDDTESDDLGIAPQSDDDDVAPQADDGTVYVLAGSDFQPTNKNHSTGVSLVNRILDKIDDKYTKMDGFLFMGDYYYGMNDPSASTAGKKALKEAVETVYGTSMSEVYVQGNHDDDSLVGLVLSKSGANDAADYGVFVINEKDYMWYNNDEATIKKTAENLKTYLDAKRTQNYTKPIFVVSHLPLHYCMRTQVGGGDGMHANYIFDVLNEAGNAGLNIIFMYGHNHSHGWDDPYGGASVFLKAGDKINIAQNSTKVYKEETLAFTYLNAGYVSYYRNVNSGAECDLSMTVFAITDNTVTVERYTADGVQPLKSAGVANTHAATGTSVDKSCSTNHGGDEKYSPNTSVLDSPYTITLSKSVTAPETPEPTPTPTPEPTPTPTPTDRTYTRVTDMGELVSGDKYLIIENSSTDYFMLPESTTKGSGSDARVGFDVESTTIAGGDTITGDYSAKEWTMTGSGNNWTLSTDSGKAYITNQDGTRAEAVISSSNSTTFTLGGSADSFTFNTSIGGKTYTFDHSTKGVINAYVKTATTKFYIYRMTSEGIVEQTVSANGVAVTAPGITGINVTVDNTNPDPQTYSAYISYDINPTGYTQGDTATVEIEVDSSFDINRPVKVIDKVKGTVTGTTIIGGVVTFTTDHFSTYDLAQARRSVTTSGGGWVLITAPVGGTTTYTYTKATSITAGNKYVIVANNAPVALMDNNKSMGKQDVSINGIDGTTMTSTTELTEWTFSGADSGTVYNGSRYLRYSDKKISINNSSSTLYFTDYGNYFRIRGDDEKSGRSLYYNGTEWTTSGKNTPQYVRLYQLVSTDSTGGTDGLYAKITGELTYNVPIGTSAEAALNAVKAGITGYKYNASSMPGASVTGTALDNSELVWTLDPSYDGVTPGDYAVTISYNGKTLGTAKVVVPQRVIVSTTLESLEGTVEKGSSLTAQTGAYIVVNYEDGGAPSRVPVTLGMLKNADGTQATAMTRGDYPNLKVVYNGNTLIEAFTLHVVGRSGNNFPEYPNEGAVKVNKTATGIDFQSTGIAQVEISASGVPSKKGADVVVVIDTSSSMRTDVPGTSKSRIQVLSESLSSMLTRFKTPGEDGENPDIDIAIIDFNGYYPGDSAEDFDKISFTGSYRKNTDLAQLFTGPNAEGYIKTVGLHATDFVNVEDITPAAIAGHFTNNTLKSGTNYDGALENAYKLLAAKKAANTVERDQYVIFLSDGAPFRYNGMNNDAGQTYNKWSEWLDGKWASRADFETEYPTASYSYFYKESIDGTTGNGQPHRYAEAIKGSPSSTFEVISRNARGNNTKYITSVNGLGATIYSIGFGLADDKNGDTDKVSVATQQRLIQVISSGDGYNYPDVHTASELNAAFNQIVGEINYAATKARFVDQMGTNFNLQTKTVSYTLPGGTSKTLTPQIEIISYDIYSAADAANNVIPQGKNIGDRKGTSTVIETVTFTTDAETGALTGAYSDQVGGGKTNILADGTKAGYVKGVIYAKNFIYNTNAEAVEVNKVVIPNKGTGGTTTNTTTAVLPAETFYWNLGTVKTTELAMRYYVYLDGSMEGTLPAGSYATNTFATLYYDNYLENPVYKDTVSPVVAWKSANVSYAFYLVNENGEIIVNQTTGQTGTFAHKIAVTVPVVYKEVLLNSQGAVNARVVARADDVLPKYYKLYDDSASYTVTVNSNGTGRWEIIKAADKEATTYVTNYNISDSSAYSNKTTETGVGNDYTHTTVWFAVVWEPQAHPDTVVIDYGLPVDIHVLSNDMFGENGKLKAIGEYNADMETLVKATDPQQTLAEGFGASYTGTFGSAAANTDTGFVRYTPTSMSMSTYEKFAYAVYFNDTITDGAKSGYYYDTITVIPATSVYYEDSFLTFTKYNEDGTVAGTWETEGTLVQNATQAEDRPGEYSTVDANNIYGYDAAYENCSVFSLGQARKVKVDENSYATANFTFAGTGFDLISMTSNKTGIINVKVKDKDGNIVANKTVNTYYGYTSEEHEIVYTYTDGAWTKVDNGVAGENTVVTERPQSPQEGSTYTAKERVWIITPDNDNSLYQVPVIKVEGLAYGTYNVEIKASYFGILDKTTEDGYVLYLDAVRIYNPTNNGAADGSTDTTIEDAYLLDGEAWPTYFELRNGLISAGTFGEFTNNEGGEVKKIEGLVFIDGNGSVGSANLSDYVSYGPKNEVYLAPGQSIAFMLDTNVMGGKDGTTNIVANIHLGVKSADGKPVKYTIANVNKNENNINNINTNAFYGVKTETINTSTDMYHDITGYKDGIIVITNTGDSGIISLTNVKSTYTENPNGDSVNVPAQPENHQEQPGTWSRVRLYMTPAAANLALSALNKGLPVENTSGSDAEITPVPAPTPDVTHNPNPDGGSTQTPGSTDTTAPTVPDVKPDTDTMPDEDVTPPTDSGDTDGTTADGEDTAAEPGESEEDTESSEDNTNPIVKFITGIVNAVVNFFRNLFGKKS